MSGLLVGVANVPSKSNHTGKDGQVWERLWTLEEMRQTSANWSLAADSGLFLFLQDFSQRMLSKTHEIEKQLDGLIRDTKATDCCMHTVFNDFLMLSNTQFIENRVYDEEVEEAVPKPEALERPSEQKTREQKEAQLIPKVQKAVNYGLMVLDSAFEQLDVKAGNSDSEDEEATDRVEPILEPKDLYVDRPLPYLIGSQLFMEQEDVGLGDLSSEGRSPHLCSSCSISTEGKCVYSWHVFILLVLNTLPSIVCHLTSSHDIAVFTSNFVDLLLLTPVCVVVAIEDDSEELFGLPKMEGADFSPFGGKGGLFSGGRGLFDDDEVGSHECHFVASMSYFLHPAEQRPRTKSSTGVFQDEELLFSHTQQRDNHPDFDIFATPDKSSRPSSVRSAAPTLFSDDDDEDDLFSSVKPKLMNKCVVPPCSQTNLVINPAALLSGASPWILGEVSVLPGLSPSSSGLSPCPAGTQSPSDGGVSLDHPVQVSVLQCANKGRAKGSIRRRPQTRAARQMSAQSSVEKKNQGEDRARPSPTLPHPTQPSLALPNPMHPSLALPNLTLPRPNLPNQAPTTALPSFLPATLPSQSPLTDVSVRPSVLTLPVSNTPLKRDFSKGSKVKVLPSPDKADLFRSDSLFGSVPALAPVPKLTTPSPKLTTKTTEGELTPKEKEATPPSLFDDPMGDLFQKVKPRSAKKAKASSFLEDEEDIFVLGKSSTPTTKITDEAETAPKAHKDKSLDASLFDDNVDIFADLTATSKPKETKSKKAETKSIFHDDMDDIFSPSTVKPMAKQPPSKSKKSPLSQDTSAADDLGNIFDHPLNALGGN
uniref:FAM21/CAPZIP domain-containing protein n=1 Tax=Hucho hucho TaxID=62062 RepID=A0A4W5RFM1_9TELE